MSMAAHTLRPVGHSVAPMLSVRNGARAVEFYKAAFGAVEVYRVQDSAGEVVARFDHRLEFAGHWGHGRPSLAGRLQIGPPLRQALTPLLDRHPVIIGNIIYLPAEGIKGRHVLPFLLR